MIEDPTSLYVPFLVIGAFFMLLGAVFGWVGAGMTGKERKETPGEKKVERPGLVEVARLWREQGSGKLVVEVGERVLPSPSDLNENLKKRLAELVVEFGKWLGMAAPMQDQPQQPAEQTRPESLTTPPVSAVPRPGSSVAAQQTPEAMGVTPPSMRMVDIMSRAVTGGPVKKDAETPAPKSIVGQIDVILQEKLENSPWRNRGIRLKELPGGGMEVVVGSERYEGVDDVADPQVRALIKYCVAEWEKRYYPK